MMLDRSSLCKPFCSSMGGMVRFLETMGMVLAIAGMIYLQYRRAKSMSDRKDQKADVTTLFDGDK